jgi:transketolase
MRDAFSNTLVSLAKADPRVLLLTGDHGYSLFDSFRRECPGQYINAGVAEQNMVGVAAGLARSGFHPFVYGLSAFVPVRVVEQIKLDVAHDNLPVVFIGDGAGFVYSHLGTSHQATEDIACTRSIPGLSVYSPADRFEISLCMHWAYAAQGPVYLRMGKSDRGDVHQAPVAFNEGRLFPIIPTASGRDVAFIATGSMVSTARRMALSRFSQASVWSVPSIKPLDAQQIFDISRQHKALIVLEEHSVLGGLGAAIAEIASELAPIRILRIGVPDRFSQHCGSYEYLLKEHGLDQASVEVRIASFLAQFD